jgi:AraC-like DNA-binding protein
VMSHLERKQVERLRDPRKMTDPMVRSAANRYATGLSLAAVATEFGVSERTLRREFESIRVSSRPRGGASSRGEMCSEV